MLLKILTHAISTIKYSRIASESYLLQKDLRKLTRLEEINQFLTQTDPALLKRNGIILLQFFNQFTVHLKLGRLEFSAFNIYKYTMMIDIGGLYDEIVRYSILEKMKQKALAETDKKMLNSLLENQKDRLVQFFLKGRFDVADAMNWIIVSKDSRCVLNENCLQILNDESLMNSNSLKLSKAFSIILKKFEIFGWNKIRKYGKIMQYISSQLVVTQFDKDNINLLERIAQLQLHLLGYRIPIAIDQIYYSIQKNINFFDFNQIMISFSLFDLLPASYNPAAFQYIFQHVAKKAEKQQIRMTSLPYRRLSKGQVEVLQEKVIRCLGNSFFARSVYSATSLQRSKIYSGEFLEVATVKLQEEIKNQTYRHRNSFHIYLGLIKIIHDKSPKEPLSDQTLSTKHNLLKSIILQIYTNFTQRYDEQYLFQNLSLTNLLTLLEFNQQYLLPASESLIEKEIQRVFFKNFDKNDNLSSLSMLKQIRETIVNHFESKHAVVRTQLASFLTKELNLKNEFNFSAYPEFMFQLMKSSYGDQEYLEVVNSYANLIGKDDETAFVECFIRFRYNNATLSMRMMNLLLRKKTSFLNIGKLMANLNFSFLQSKKGYVLSPLRNYLQEITPLINVQTIKDFSISELLKIIRFLIHYGHAVEDFLLKFVKLNTNNILKKLQSSQEDERQKAEFGDFQTVKSLLSYLLNCIKLTSKFGIEKQIYCQRLHQILSQLQLLFEKSLGKEKNNRYIYFQVKTLEIKLLLQNSIQFSENAQNAMLDDILEYLAVESYSLSLVETMVILLKLNLLKLIKVKAQVLEKLVGQVKDSCNNNQLHAADMVEILSEELLDQWVVYDQVHLLQVIQLLELSIQKTKVMKISLQVCVFYLQLYQKVDHKDPSKIQKVLSFIPFCSITPYAMNTQILSILFKYIRYCTNPAISSHLMKEYLQSRDQYSYSQEIRLIFFLEMLSYNQVAEMSNIIQKVFQSCQTPLLDQINELRSVEERHERMSISKEDGKNKKVFLINQSLKVLCISVKNGILTRKVFQVFAFLLHSIQLVKELVQSKRLSEIILPETYLLFRYFLSVTKENQTRFLKINNLIEPQVKKSNDPEIKAPNDPIINVEQVLEEIKELTKPKPAKNTNTIEVLMQMSDFKDKILIRKLINGIDIFYYGAGRNGEESVVILVADEKQKNVQNQSLGIVKCREECLKLITKTKVIVVENCPAKVIEAQI